VVILNGPQALWNDESWYIASVPELHRLGLSRTFLREMPGPAGPLYAVFHALLEPLTGLRPPGIRLATAGLSVLTFAAVGAALRARGVSHPFLKGAAMVAAPMLAMPIGTAMTEMPAEFFFCVSLALLLPAVDHARRGSPAAYPLAALAGLSCGLAITGRQQFLMAAFASVALWRRSTWRVGLIYGLLAAAVPAPVFLAWGGLVTPSYLDVETGISVPHGLFALSFAGVVYCIYDVGWLLRRPALAAAVVAATTAANLLTGWLTQYPFHMIAMRLLGPTALHYYARVAPGLMLGFGLLFLVHLARVAYEGRDDPAALFLCLATLLLIGASAKITTPFIGRYIVTALPILLILAAERAPDTYGKAARLALGCVGGVVSLVACLTTR
jgi:hypothetical protein